MEAGQTSRVCRHKSWAHTVFDEESKTQIFNSISLCRFRSFFYSSDVTRRRGNYRFMERIGHRIQGNSHCRRSCNGVRGSWLALADFSSLVSIPAILTIKQSFVGLSCVMHTSEMSSRSFLADFWLDGDKQIRRFGYSYTSTPLPSVDYRSKPHEGTMAFVIIGDPVNELKGGYWTEQNTTGEVTLTFQQPGLVEKVPDNRRRHPSANRRRA
jgi:hypothetical protein